MKIQVGRYTQILARLLQGAGDLEVAAELSPEISPVFVLESDRPEWVFLANGRLMAGRSFIAGGGATIATVRLHNPSTSNVLAVLEGGNAWCSATSGFTVRQAATAADLANLDAPQLRDPRPRVTGALVGAVHLSNLASPDAATGVSVEDYSTILAGVAQPLVSVPAVLMPGSAIEFRASAVNTTLVVNLRWREREIGKFEVR